MTVVPFAPKPSSTDFVETPTYTKIVRLVADCHVHRRLGVIRGGFGIGKTYGLEVYAAWHPGEVALATLNPAARSVTAGMAVVTEGIERARVPMMGQIRKAALYHPWIAWREVRTACRAFRDDPEGRRILFIVDEAQHARPDLLDALRAIWDAGGCGLVVAGNERLFNPRLGRMTEADFGALLSRAHHVLDMPRSTAADIDAVLAHYRVSAAESRALLHDVAAAGGLREVIAVIGKAREITGAPLVNLKALRAAAKSTGLAAATWTRRRK